MFCVPRLDAQFLKSPIAGKRLSLFLLMARVSTNHPDPTSPADHFTFCTYFLNGTSYTHENYISKYNWFIRSKQERPLPHSSLIANYKNIQKVGLIAPYKVSDTIL